MDAKSLNKKLDILEIARAGGLIVKRQSNRIYRAKCVYHADGKSPNLTLYPLTNTFKCYACEKHGDAINLYAHLQGISNTQAIKELNQRSYAVPSPTTALKSNMSDFPSKKVYPAEACKTARKQGKNITKEQKDAIFNALKEFCDPLDAESLNYLTSDKRGLTEDTIKKFKIFCVKSYRNAKEFLSRRASLEDLKAIGLFNDRNRFIFTKNKIIIPVIEDGLIVNLRGRFFDKGLDDPSGLRTTYDYPKYQNLKGVSIRDQLFNGDILKTAPAGDRVYLCEGEFDTMILDQRGVKAVGTLGAGNFNKDLLKRLKPFEVAICFDNDQTGKGRALEVANALEDLGIMHDKILINTLPDGVKDITEFIIKKDRAKNEAL